MRNIHKKALSLMLAIICLLTSVGCKDGERDVVQSGIEIADDPSYRGEVLERAESVLLSLVRYGYLSLSSLENISATVDRRIVAYAQRITALSADNPISETQYLEVIEVLEKSGEAVVDELIAFIDGGEPKLECTRDLYLVMSGAFGADRSAAMLYDVCLVVYDMEYEIAKERFDAYGYPWYEEEARELLAQKENFIDSIGREDFSALIRFATALAEVA